MDALKIKRTPLRVAFTKTYNTFSEALSDATPDANLIENLMRQLKYKSTRLRAVDEEILNFMLTEKILEKDYTKKFEACEEYTE